MKPDYDCVVIGAGVVGIAIAREAAMRGMTTLLLERHAQFGSETSSRNSEVIHAGIYYPPGSLKARCCVRGREALYRFVEERGIAHRACGKLIVASSEEQLSDLEALHDRAQINGVSDLKWLDKSQVRRAEPQLDAVAAIHSPHTGIVDSHGFMLALLGEAEANGCQLALNTQISGISRKNDAWTLFIEGSPDPVLTTRMVVNAAGLEAAPMLRRIEGYPEQGQVIPHFAKGTYFTYDGPVPFDRLVYPVPQPGGLGIHLTLDLQGRARFGPDVEWVDRPEYDVDAGKRSSFAESIRAYWPGVEAERLQPGYVGVRPKIVGPGEAAADFVVEGPESHGLGGLINLLGIESPGLTSSLALAEIAIDRLIGPD